MKFSGIKYYISLIVVTALFIGGCTDEFLNDREENRHNPDYVGFSARVGLADMAQTRGMGDNPEYEPLVLTGAHPQPLYLHTYEVNRVGFRPGRDEMPSNTRGMQIITVDDLVKFHKDFSVHAQYRESGEEYMPWLQAEQAATQGTIWHTQKSYRWPSDNVLSFHAVSPSSERERLARLTEMPSGMKFVYTALKGSADNDAVMQQDLLLAASSCNKKGSVEGLAPLKFHHALSAVKFAVRDVLDGEVVNVRIAGIRNSGVCSYSCLDDGSQGVFVWSNQNGTETYSQNFNYKIDGRPIVDPSDDSQDILLNGTMPEKTFFLIPQEIPDNAEIIITLDRKGYGPIEVRGNIKANGVSEWKAGYEYVYTISTSKDNWQYILTPTGNYSKGEITENGDTIFVYNPSNEMHEKYKDTAWFRVLSYRYRLNNPYVIEDLPWSASHGDGKQIRVSGPFAGYVENRDVKAAEWIQDPDNLSGNGTHGPEGELHNLKFAAHHQMTDWPGDAWMQDRPIYPGNSKSTPTDLSKRDAGGTRNTANCYVIDREGWYCFPLVYGNAITGGQPITTPYSFSTTATAPSNEKWLKTFAHASGNIADAWISTTPDVSAGLVWADVYNAIDPESIQVVTLGSEKMIRFKANKYNLQQGNVVIALYSGANQTGDVMWSWHIWITEHWLDPETGKSHAFDTSGAAFKFDANEETGWRRRGDVTISDPNRTKARYQISAYNIGWCDPKNVDYLRRVSAMDFVQYLPDGRTLTHMKASLPICQEGEHVEYKFGNNTYYQFGRKDPSVGFVDHSHTLKPDFGPKPYLVTDQGRSMAYGIKHPEELFCKGISKVESKKNGDWASTTYINLWNNSTAATYQDYAGSSSGTHLYLYHGKKTVYDPSPPGYMVPPAAVWKCVGTDNNGSYANSVGGLTRAQMKLNGDILDTYTYYVDSKVDQPGDANESAKRIWLPSTGQRWYTDYREVYDNNGRQYNGGDNFNGQIVYLWSNCNQVYGSTGGAAYSLALGLDGSIDETGSYVGKYVIAAFFSGRRSMARPVRAVREAYTAP